MEYQRSDFEKAESAVAMDLTEQAGNG